MGVLAPDLEATPGTRGLVFHSLWFLHSWALAVQFCLWFLEECRESDKSLGTGSSSRFLWLLSSGPQALCVIHAGYSAQQGSTPSYCTS